MPSATASQRKKWGVPLLTPDFTWRKPNKKHTPTARHFNFSWMNGITAG